MKMNKHCILPGNTLEIHKARRTLKGFTFEDISIFEVQVHVICYKKNYHMNFTHYINVLEDGSDLEQRIQEYIDRLKNIHNYSHVVFVGLTKGTLLCG